jgi:hypothetical protein
MTLRPANPRLVELEPFVVARPAVMATLDLEPFGLRVAADARVDPLRLAARPLLELLVRLDALTFGPQGMPMPRWMFVEGAGLPGAIVGLGRRGPAPALLDAPAGYAGVVPLAMYIAVPAFEPGTWVGHNLASLAARVGDGELRGLGAHTKAVALRVLRARTQLGVTQWGNPALRLHARLGPLELLSAWTPAHSDPATLTYRVSVDEAALRQLARDPAGRVAAPPAAFTVDSDDLPALRALQARIEAGERFAVAAPATALSGGRQRAPIARWPS